jgi:hypothetical protein
MRCKEGKVRSTAMDQHFGRWWLWSLAASAVVLVVGLVSFWAGRAARRPVCQGKTLTLWLRTYAPSSRAGRNSPEWKKADDAVRQIGTNCTPVLLQMIRARDSRLKLALISLARKQHLIKVQFVLAEELNVEASRAFIVLGDAAKDAVPLLMKTYDENISTESQRAIADAMAWIGPSASSAIPLLLRAVTNSDASVRANALWALGDIHAKPELCVPELVRGLNDSNFWARLSAAHALGMFGADAQAAIAPLSELTNIHFQAVMGMDFQVSLEARNALRKIKKEVESFPGFEFPTADTGFLK